MALQHDAATGFLRGESVADEIDKLAQELKLLRAIEANTGDIAKRLLGLGLTGTPVQPDSVGANGRMVLPAARNDSLLPLAPAASADRAPVMPVINITPVVPRQAGTKETSAQRGGPAIVGPAATAANETGPGGGLGPRATQVKDAAPNATPASAATPPSVQDHPSAQPAINVASVAAPSARPSGAVGQPPEATPRQAGTRDVAGRFTSEQDRAAKDVDEGGEAPGAVKAVGSAIVDAVRDIRGSSPDVDGVDPAIQAGKELGAIVSPAFSLFKPFGRLFGRNNSNDTKQTKQHRESIAWWRRIWRAQADGNKAKGSGGLLRLLGLLLPLLTALMAPILALSKLLGLTSLLKSIPNLLPGRRPSRARPDRARRKPNTQPDARRNATTPDGGRKPGAQDPGKRPGAAGPGGQDPGKRTGTAGPEANGPDGKRASPKPGKPTPALNQVSKKGLPKLLKSIGPELLSAGKGLLRKIPILGALFGGAMIASDVMADDDPNKSAEENRKEKWGNVGGGIGSLIGGAIGILGGPVGVVIGGIVGDLVGGLVGEWLSTVDFDAVLNTVTQGFNDLVAGAGEMASAAWKSVQDGWASLVNTGSKALTGMMDWARESWDKVTNKLLDVKDTIADKVQGAKDYVSEKVDSAKDAGSNVLYKATGGRLGTGGSDAAREQMIKAMDAGGITDPRSKAMLMANVDHESGGFTKTEENLNYSAKRLQEVFPKYYKNAEEARADAGNPEAIANKVYGGRMGNTEAGDGYKYRGRGALQLTGKAQYAEMSKKLGVDLVNNPELAADPKYSAQIAVAHWKASGADKAAQAGDIEGARRRTNGGTNGLADVKAKYENTYLGMAKAGDLTPTRRADEMKVAAPEKVNEAVASTMSAISPAKTVASAPVTQAPTPIGVLAPTQLRAQQASVAAPSIPATIAAAPLRSYAPAAADAGQTRIPATPEIKAPPGGTGGNGGSTSVSVEVPLSQSVGDRDIAHVSAGGLGMPR